MQVHQPVKSKSFGFGFRAGGARRLVGVSSTWAKELAEAERKPLSIPDILHLEPRISAHADAIGELLELAFHGKEAAKGLDRKLGELEVEGVGWNLDLFANDLFVDELIKSCFTIRIDGIRFPVNRVYLYRVLSDPPTRVEAVAFRQEILRELDGDEALHRNTKELYQELSQLLSMFKSPDHAAKLDINAFRLDILKQARRVVDWMVDGFGDARSGLRRLHDAGLEIQQSPEYAVLADLLEYESRLGTLRVELGVGGDGEIKHLQILEAEESRQNRFYRSPLRRILLRFKIFFLYGYKLSRGDRQPPAARRRISASRLPCRPWCSSSASSSSISPACPSATRWRSAASPPASPVLTTGSRSS